MTDADLKRYALIGLRKVQVDIECAIADLMITATSKPSVPTLVKKRRKISAAGRKRMSEGQKRRWAGKKAA